MNLVPALHAIRLLQRPATLRRTATGAWQNDGTFARNSTPVNTSMLAVIQAPGVEDLRLLPEGEVVEGKVVIWTETELKPSDEATGREADHVVSPRGDAYKIIAVKQRDEAGFYRAIGSLHDDRGRSL